MRKGTSSDPFQSLRTIQVYAEDISYAELAGGATASAAINIVRPPVVLVHGIWGAEDDWNGSGENGVGQQLELAGLFGITAANYNGCNVPEAPGLLQGSARLRELT